MTTALCQLGPAEIIRMDGATTTSESVDAALSEAALDGGDGRTVLVGDEPVALSLVWRAALQSLLSGAHRTVLIHPSWWPSTRVTAVRDAAANLVPDVETASRAQVLAQGSDVVVVEIAAQVVAVVVDGVPVSIQSRSATPEVVAGEVVATVVSRHTGGTVMVDAPPTVAGAAALQTLITGKLAGEKVRVRVVTDAHLRAAAARDHPTAQPPPVSRRLRRPVLMAAGISVGLVAVAAWTLRPADGPRQYPVIDVSVLVEGRVVMDVPAGWTVRRITGGPGSARVQVMSPSDGEVMLHLTQSQVPGTDLAATAAVLRRLVDSESPGTFIDFNPADTRAGRPAVSYRELRPGREILWVVLVEHDVRISIGCQHAAGDPQAVATACDDAVRTARRVE